MKSVVAAVLILGLVAGLPAWALEHAVKAADEGVAVAPMLNRALPNVEGANFVTATLTVAPGAHSSPHRHGGFLFGYVISGKVRSQLKGQATPTLYEPGSHFEETAADTHVFFENPSRTVPARLLIVWVVKSGDALTSPVGEAK